MKITKDQLHASGANSNLCELFLQLFPSGEAAYQDVLNALAEEDMPGDAHWLMDKVGPDLTAVLEVKAITNTKHLFFAGTIRVERSAILSGSMRAGWAINVGSGLYVLGGIKSGWGIKVGVSIHAGLEIDAGGSTNAMAGDIMCGRSIKVGLGMEARGEISAGESIDVGLGMEAGGEIKCGEGWSCCAGLKVQPNKWPMYARVIAKNKPANLDGGYWVGPSAKAEARLP